MRVLCGETDSVTWGVAAGVVIGKSRSEARAARIPRRTARSSLMIGPTRQSACQVRGRARDHGGSPGIAAGSIDSWVGRRPTMRFRKNDVGQDFRFVSG